MTDESRPELHDLGFMKRVIFQFVWNNSIPEDSPFSYIITENDGKINNNSFTVIRTRFDPIKKQRIYKRIIEIMDDIKIPTSNIAVDKLATLYESLFDKAGLILGVLLREEILSMEELTEYFVEQLTADGI